MTTKRHSEKKLAVYSECFLEQRTWNNVSVTYYYESTGNQPLAARSSNGLSSGEGGTISFFLKTTLTTRSKSVQNQFKTS